MTTLDQALAVLKEVRAFSPTAIIAGGCARDLAHGLTPKDYDIIVPLQTDLFNLKNRIRAMADEGTYRAFVFGERGDTGGYSEDDRVIMCLKATIGGVDFDVLLYNVQDHALLALDYFDFNLNQYFLDNDGVPHYGGNRHQRPEVSLVEVRGDATPARAAYILKKHQTLYPNLY